MNFGEQPPKPSPAEIAKTQALQNAELIQGGADYVESTDGSLRLDLTKQQMIEAKEEMYDSKRQEEAEKEFDTLEQEQKLEIETLHHLNELDKLLEAKLNKDELIEINDQIELIRDCVMSFTRGKEYEHNVSVQIMAHELRNSDRLKAEIL